MEFPVPRDAIDRGLEHGLLRPAAGRYELTEPGRVALAEFLQKFIRGDEEILLVDAAA